MGSSVRNHFLGFTKYTKIDQLSVNELPTGSVVACSARPRRRSSRRRAAPTRASHSPKAGKLNLLKPFEKKKLPPGTRVTVTITAPGFIGKALTYTMRKGKTPKLPTKVCIPPGGKPGKCK